MADWIDIGKVQTLPRGEYASTTQYEKNDVVEYQHYSFICRKSCVGTPPTLNTTTEYWQQIAEAPESKLSALTDVSITSVVDKQALVYDASTQKWINGESGTKIEKLDDIGDVTVSATPSNKDVLSYDSASGKWKNDASISDDIANKQDKTDNSLETTSKTVVGAINEVNSAINPTAIISTILNTLYPIGSIYLETTNTNPSAKLGGTWVAFGASDTYLRLGGNSSGGSNTISVANLPSHNHSVGAHSHGLNNHTHSIPALSGTAASAGSHAHTIGGSTGYGGAGNVARGDTSWTSTAATDAAGAHTHTVTTTASTTGKASGNTANSTAFDSGNTGSGTAFEPKYVQVYAWKRTA